MQQQDLFSSKEISYSVSRKFTSAEEALEKAKGHYPLNYLVAIGGNARATSDYVFDEGTLRAILDLRDYGKHEGDALFVWLPEQDVGADMVGVS